MTAPPSSPAGPTAGAPAAPGRTSILISALRRRGQERFSGTLRVQGGQDGTVLLRAGLVVAATTSAAPGPESLVLRSGRIDEAEWTAAFAAAAPYGRFAAELVERGLIGSAGVEVLTQTATVDAIFAMVLSGVRTCAAEPAAPGDTAPLLPVEPGLETDRLIRELTRRSAAAADWARLGLRIDARPFPVAGREPPADADRSAILSRVNGRRTTRDIAFTVGRGLYSVMTGLAVLVEDGHVTFTPAATGAAVSESADEAADDTGETAEEAADTSLEQSGDLPRRRRGPGVINRMRPRRGER